MSARRFVGALATLATAFALAVVGVAPASAAASSDRVYGPDRYDTSVAISKETFSAGVGVVYVASGLNFSDALAGGPAAATKGAPILLVRDTAVPASVTQELQRLRPGRIVVLGGPGSVSDAVVAQLRSYTAGGVERMWGADRYDTSVAISRASFGAGQREVFVASGEVFSDALPGGAAAGRSSSPVLLVRGSKVPAAVEQELSRLSPAKITVLGGPGTITDAVAATLGRHAPVSRISGHDRYAVSSAISRATFPNGASTVYLANGLDYPDALTGVPVAVQGGGPVLLARPDRVPAEVQAEIDRLSPDRIVLLGGPASVVDPNAAPVTPAPSTPGMSYNTATYDAQILGLLNAERAKHGLPALRASEPMRRTSQANSAEMALTGFAHDSNAEIQSEIYAAGCRYNWRENIHYTDGRWTNQVLMDPSNPVRYWMASVKGHREAILHPNMRYAGMGSVVYGNKVYNTLRLAENCS